ncbi:MAG: GrpB family protein [Bacillota bacterium]|nr:GrpB family protein [Bacillota bacterium]
MGSTSVQGLCAEPIIDILLVVEARGALRGRQD